MNTKVREIYLVIMYILILAAGINLIFRRLEYIWLSIIMIVLWLLCFSVRNLLLYNTSKWARFITITYLFEVGIMLTTGKLWGGDEVKLFLLITLMDCCIKWGKNAVICLALILIGDVFILHTTFSELSPKLILMLLIKESPIIFLTAIISYLSGKVFEGSFLLEKSIKDIEEREVRLQMAYQDLNRAYEGLEEMATLKERNRIAREIHDTVGHTLTTVIVEMEAGRMLADREPADARNRYEMAQAQAVKALDEMRYSVRMLSDKSHQQDLSKIIEEILHTTMNHTGVKIKYEIDVPNCTEDRLNQLLARALKEGISNSIRHGKSTAFFVKLWKDNGQIRMLIQDNGTGCHPIEMGFGLTSMQQGIKQAGGWVKFSSEPQEGFEISISLPFKEQTI